MIGLDIAMYFGEVFIHNRSDLCWGFKTEKRFMDRNQPLIVGFSNDFSINPREYIHGMMHEALEDKVGDINKCFKVYERFAKL